MWKIIKINWLLKSWNDVWDHEFLCNSESLWCPLLPLQVYNISSTTPWIKEVLPSFRLFCNSKILNINQKKKISIFSLLHYLTKISHDEIVHFVGLKLFRAFYKNKIKKFVPDKKLCFKYLIIFILILLKPEKFQTRYIRCKCLNFVFVNNRKKFQAWFYFLQSGNFFFPKKPEVGDDSTL